MSLVGKLKSLQLQDCYDPPTPEQQIVKVIKVLSNNLLDVETPDGENFLVSIPKKFRGAILFNRGMFMLIEEIKEGKRVRGELTRVLESDVIKHFHETNVWPKAFEIETIKKKTESDSRVIPLQESDSESSTTEVSDSDESEGDYETESDLEA